uniref:Troponin I4b, tandem duplicate 1 n=1 Tax=Scleropages formosus TaxID=113540 RepID=A0A8C9TPA3_SCLFO
KSQKPVYDATSILINIPGSKKISRIVSLKITRAKLRTGVHAPHSTNTLPMQCVSLCAIHTPISVQNLCRELHQKIDVVDEARYDIETKVAKNEKEIEYLNHKIFELKGKMKRPNLKRVKKSADDMLGAIADTKLTKADFKANLKTVKKEEEKVEEVTDWRKNVEAMSGMEGRKKLFDAAQ